jgi:hypothetical protein
MKKEMKTSMINQISIFNIDWNFIKVNKIR